LSESKSSTDSKITEVISRSEQLHTNILHIEQNIDGRLADNVSSIQTELGLLNEKNKANTQLIVSLQESINIQSEEAKKVNAERQTNAIKEKENEANISANAQAISELKNVLDESIIQKMQPTEDKVDKALSEVQIINKTMTIFESHHSETIKSLKEVNLMITKIESKIKEQEQKITEENISEINDIKKQLLSLEHKLGASAEERDSIKKEIYNWSLQLENMDAGNQQLVEKLRNTENNLVLIKKEADGLGKEGDAQHKRISELEKNEITNSSDIKTLMETSSRYLQHIQDLEILNDKVNNMDDTHSRTESRLRTELIGSMTLNAEDIKNFCISNINKTEQSILEKITILKDECDEMSEKVVAIQDFAALQEQKAHFVETLSSRVNQMDEMRQQSEAKVKQEFDEKDQRNASEIQELKHHLQIALSDLEKQMKTDTRLLKAETTELRKNGSNLLERLAVYEDNIDKRINTNIMPKIEHLDILITDFGKEVNKLRNENSAEFNSQGQKIISLFTAKEEHSSILERHSSNISTIESKIITYDHKQKAIAESLLITSEGQFTEMKNRFDAKIAELISITNDQGSMLGHHDNRLAEISEQSRKLEKELQYTNQEVEELKRQGGEDRGLVVMRFKETNDTLESFFRSLETLKSTQSQESTRVEIISRQTESQERLASQLEAKIQRMERFGEEQNSLILAVEKTANDKVEEIESELQAYVAHSQQDLRDISTRVDRSSGDLWDGLDQLSCAVRGSTVVIKSEGAVRVHQSDVLGVYRMVDSYNKRPVYKQDGGENYIYYSSASKSWFVGTVVGHQYGWLRNTSEEAATRRWVPDLAGGWEYRPLVRGADSIGQNTWLRDDGTLRIESLTDVDKVNEAIQGMKNQGSVQ